MNTVNQQIDLFTGALANMINAEYDRRGFPHAKITVEPGRRYARIVVNRGFNSGYSARCVYCFIDLSTGDILKAASWKAPQKNGRRGSIFSNDLGLSCCNVFGLKYLR